MTNRLTLGAELLASAVQDSVTEGQWLKPGDVVVVAFSGGLDSAALLHVLRFFPPVPGVRIVAAHLDHGWRPDSGDDAEWARGVARAWGVPFETGTVDQPPANEAEARELRYRFLQKVRQELLAQGAGARVWIATAHHADDQAETVLFRILRGTGRRGLRAILPRLEQGVIRPLLQVWRKDIEAYAASVGLRWREDSTNRDLSRARNVLRHSILPAVEEAVAPGARRALVRLVQVVAEEQAGIDWLVEKAFKEVREPSAEGCVKLSRDKLLSLPPHVRRLVVCAAGEKLGLAWNVRRVESALEFVESGQSGKRIDLPGGLVMERSFGAIFFAPSEREDSPPHHADEAVVVIGSALAAEAILKGRRVEFRARWGPIGAEPPESDPASMGRWSEGFAEHDLRWPLRLRWWQPGDRVRLHGGSAKLKKVFGEREIPRDRRRRLPVLVDADSSVLWVPGVVRSILAPLSERAAWCLAIEEL